MEYYSVIKSNAFESVPMRWINLEPIMQSEVIQKVVMYDARVEGCRSPIPVRTPKSRLALVS